MNKEPIEAFPYKPPSDDVKEKYKHIFGIEGSLPPRFFKSLFDKSLAIIVLTLTIPILLLLNKIDNSEQKSLEKLVNEWKIKLPTAEILPISALKKMSIQFILPKILEWLPENPPYFDKDQLTNKSMRFFVSEIIREKILLIYQKEVPYSCEVVVEEYKDEEKIVRIRANIMVSRTSQKSIVIGHQGKKIKKLGTDARLDIEAFISKKVYLELYVKVDKDWRDKEGKLKKYGY